MQLTTRQREFVRIAGWALLVSVALGAVFGHFQAPNDTGRGYIHGVVAAILISGTILLLELTNGQPGSAPVRVHRGTKDRPIRTIPNRRRTDRA